MLRYIINIYNPNGDGIGMHVVEEVIDRAKRYNINNTNHVLILLISGLWWHFDG
jgi:hypothetical protein